MQIALFADAKPFVDAAGGLKRKKRETRSAARWRTSKSRSGMRTVPHKSSSDVVSQSNTLISHVSVARRTRSVLVSSHTGLSVRIIVLVLADSEPT